MAMKLTTENVNFLEAKILDEISYWENESKDAEKTLVYIAGIHDMANAVRRMIRELGGC
jgi:hypothetical protein